MTYTVTVEVVFASERGYQIFSVDLPSGSRIETVIEQSGILVRFPEIQKRNNQVGIFGVLKRWDDIVESGDRIEIYRPLKKTPIERRKENIK